MGEIILGPEFKSLPPSAWGSTARQFLTSAPAIDQFQTPLLTLDRSALRHNVRVMAEWLSKRGLRIAPHGKTTMAPQLWQQLLDAGAWGITLATGWQVELARSFGIRRILLANSLIDPVVLRWLASELSDPDFEFSCWVDSVETVGAMRAALAGVSLPRPIDVIVELGGPGGRTGARTVATALEVVAAVEASPELSLVGVGGYEGSLAHDRTSEAIARVTGYLDRVVQLHDSIEWNGRRAIVTAGGSAYFEFVAERFATLVERATVVLRSGAYQVHDDGFYLGISPFSGGEHPFRAAMHGWVRVVSRPEPGLAILDGGKRDFPFDDGLPTVQLVVGFAPEESAVVVAGSEIVAINDQHAYLRISDGADLPVGSVLRLGLSHPCTAFDKWRLIPVIDDATSDRPTVVDLVRTWF